VLPVKEERLLEIAERGMEEENPVRKAITALRSLRKAVEPEPEIIRSVALQVKERIRIKEVMNKALEELRRDELAHSAEVSELRKDVVSGWEGVEKALEMIEGYWRVVYDEEQDYPGLRRLAREVNEALEELKEAVKARKSVEVIREKMGAFESNLATFSRTALEVVPDPSGEFKKRLRWAIIENILGIWLPVLSERLDQVSS
jgi:hypothetical protein